MDISEHISRSRWIRSRAYSTFLLGLSLLSAAHSGITQELTSKVVDESSSHSASGNPHTLEGSDLNTWLDGFIPYALQEGNVAGAVIAVVKDGKVLTQRGYGYADVAAAEPIDPRTTLFRPGSTSKLITWTAVMQLVEAGKLALDQDIRTDLDFDLPESCGKPITLRNLLTHTAGFQERGKDIFVPSGGQPPPLSKFVRDVPPCIFPPGTVPAYSNYGAALAGYIVQRISGEPFEQYVERHIFQPLGMENSTFVQPLPPSLKPHMATGYIEASGPPVPYELIGPAPAGSLATTADDMAKFMIAHLQGGGVGDARILRPETAKLMHASAFVAAPPLPGMALGFYHEDRNGHVIVGHAGDTAAFHADLHLFINDGVGLFINLNSAGKQGAARQIREQLFRQFTDRYFPAYSTPRPTVGTARHDAALMSGYYILSRRADSNFLRIAYLLAPKVVTLPDGTIVVSMLLTPAGTPKHWREVGPLLWQEVDGESRLAAIVRDGRVWGFATDDLPQATVFQRAPGALSPSWNVPLLIFTFIVLLITLLLWPVKWFLHRRLGWPAPLTWAAARWRRLVNWFALNDFVLLLGWLLVIGATASNLTLLNDSLDPWLRGLQLLGVLAIVGAGVAILDLLAGWRGAGRSRWGQLASIARAVAFLAVVWFILSLKLITLSMNY